MALLDDVTKVFRATFEQADLMVDRETTADDVDKWDSLTHVGLILAIEEKFGIRLSAGEIASLDNVGDLLDVIEVKNQRK